MMVTPFYAALISLWLLLSQLVLRPRSRAQESHRPELNASLADSAYLPLALVMMLALELSRYSIYVLHAIGIVLLLSRVLYDCSFNSPESSRSVTARMLGLVLLLVEAVLCIYQSMVAHWIWCCAA
jgi:uncharacterized membrane protein YecN with MAPEG domain